MSDFKAFLQRANIEDDLDLVLAHNRGVPLNCNNLAVKLESYWFRDGNPPAHPQDMIIESDDFIDLMVKVAHICVGFTMRRVNRLKVKGDRLNKPLQCTFWYDS